MCCTRCMYTLDEELQFSSFKLGVEELQAHCKVPHFSICTDSFLHSRHYSLLQGLSQSNTVLEIPLNWDHRRQLCVCKGAGVTEGK